MPERFYAPVDLTQPTVALTGPEAHHLSNVLRLKAGGRVVLFDGEGTEAVAEIASVSRKVADLRILELTRDAESSAPALVLATAVPKGERFRWLVEKATELGVARLVPLTTERSVVDPREGKLEKLRQVVVAACKQCRRNRLMELDAAIGWNEFIARDAATDRMLVAHPQGRPMTEVLDEVEPAPDPLILAVGPEGGFTEAEITAATTAGAAIVGLGKSILRIETAALAMAAIAAVQRR